MARQIRLEFSGALYHITTCGALREDIFLRDDDRSGWQLTALIWYERKENCHHRYCRCARQLRGFETLAENLIKYNDSNVPIADVRRYCLNLEIRSKLIDCCDHHRPRSYGSIVILVVCSDLRDLGV